jgi:glutathione S-transferase
MRKVKLRYFDCRGRAQALRHLLAERGVDFVDHREPITDIGSVALAMKTDAERGGAFGMIPLLEWDDARISQTLPIAGFILRKLGSYAGLDDAAIAHQEALASASYMELTHALPQLVWAPVFYPDAPLGRTLRIHSRAACSYPHRFEALLEREYFGGSSPLASDFFVYEGLCAWRRVFGEPYLELCAQLPRLAAWFQRLTARLTDPALESMPFTASPHENAVIAQTRDYARQHGLPWAPDGSPRK